MAKAWLITGSRESRRKFPQARRYRPDNASCAVFALIIGLPGQPIAAFCQAPSKVTLGVVAQDPGNCGLNCILKSLNQISPSHFNSIAIDGIRWLTQSADGFGDEGLA